MNVILNTISSLIRYIAYTLRHSLVAILSLSALIAWTENSADAQVLPEQKWKGFVGCYGSEDFCHEDGITCLCWSASGKIIACGGGAHNLFADPPWNGDCTIRSFDRDTGSPLVRFIGHKEEIAALAFSLDASLLASVDRKGSVILWESATGRQVKSFASMDYLNAKYPKQGLYEINISDDGEQVAIANNAGWITVLGVATGSKLREHQFAATSCMAFDGECRFGYIPDECTSIVIYDWKADKETQSPLPVVQDSEGWKQALALASDLKSVIISYQDASNNSCLLHLSPGGHSSKPLADAMTHKSASLSRDGRLMALVSFNYTLNKSLSTVFLAKDMEQVASFQFPQSYPPSKVSLSPDGTQAAFAFHSGFSVARVPADDAGITFVKPPPQLNSAAISCEGKYVAIHQSDETLRVYDTKSRELILNIPSAYPMLCFAEPSPRLIIATNNILKIANLDQGKIESELSFDTKPQAALVHAACDNSGNLRLMTRIGASPLSSNAFLQQISMPIERLHVASKDNIYEELDSSHEIIPAKLGNPSFNRWYVSRSGKILCSWHFKDSSARVMLWDLGRNAKLWDMNGWNLCGVVFSGDESLLAFGAIGSRSPSRAEIYTVKDGRHVTSIQIPGTIATPAGFIGPKNYLITSHYDGSNPQRENGMFSCVWDTKTGTEIIRIPELQVVHSAIDSYLVVARDSRGMSVVLDMSAYPEVFHVPCQN